MNYIEIETVDEEEIIINYHDMLKNYQYLKINRNISILEWILFSKEKLCELKAYEYLDSLLSNIGYDKIHSVAFIKLAANSDFSFNRQNTYKKNFRVYDIPLMGGGRIDYCNDKKSIYTLEFNNLYLINAEKNLQIINHTDTDYIFISITVKNNIQHLNLANSFIPPVIKNFYNYLHFNKKLYLDHPDSDNYLFKYRKLNETIIKKSEYFINIHATSDIFSLLVSLKTKNNIYDVYIWLYEGLDINIQELRDYFLDSKFNIYYNVAPLDSYKWGALITIYLFKKYYTKALLITNKIQILSNSIGKIFEVDAPLQITCAYGFNFKDRENFNNKTLVYNKEVDYASLDFAIIPLELISDEFFNWVINMGEYISRMEHIFNVYSVANKKYKLVSYDLGIKFKIKIMYSKIEIAFINSCYKNFIKKYNYPFKNINLNGLEKIEDIDSIIVTIVLRNNICLDNLIQCLNSIVKQNSNCPIRVCLINDCFWGDYNIIDSLIEFIHLDNWYYIDTFNIGTFSSIQAALELLKVEDNDVIINIDPNLILSNENIIREIEGSFRENRINILFGNISFGDIPIFDYTLINWSDYTHSGFDKFLERDFSGRIINPLINKKYIYANPFRYLISFPYKYFKYVSQENFNNNFVIEMLNKAAGSIEVFCKPLSKCICLDNHSPEKTNYKKGQINYNKFILKNEIAYPEEITFRLSRRKYLYEYIRKKSQTLYIIFVSDSKWNTISHLFHLFRHINCNIVLLRDNNNYFLNGVPLLSNNVDFTIEYIRKLRRRTNSKILKTYGLNDSGFAAIYYGIVCCAQSIIVKDPIIKIEKKTENWKYNIRHNNSTKVFFDLKNIRSRVPIKYITTKKNIDFPNSLNIEVITSPHIDLGYFVKDIILPV